MASFEHARIGRAHVIRLEGDFDLPEHAAALSDAFDRHGLPDALCVVVNWAGIRRMGSVGFTELLKLEGRMRPEGEIRHCCLDEQWREIVTLLYHRRPPNHFETEQEAIDSCAESKQPDEP